MYSLRITEDVEVSEDVVQDSFVMIWNLLLEEKEIENLQAYLYQTVRNKSLSYLRNQNKYLDETYIPELVDEKDIDTSIRDAKIWKAIDSLPAKCREIFLLSKRDGLSNEEISEELGISVKTVKNQMTKAFSRLRESLDANNKPFFLPFL